MTSSGTAAGAQDGSTRRRMLSQSGVDFPIKIMQQAGDAPLFGIFAEFFGIEPHGGFDREHVFD